MGIAEIGMYVERHNQVGIMSVEWGNNKAVLLHFSGHSTISITPDCPDGLYSY